MTTKTTPNLLSQPFTAETMLATTSGTAQTFTNIPSWVKRITMMFNGVSTNGTSPLIIQIGSGSYDATSYNGAVASLINAGAVVSASFAAGFIVANTITSGSTVSGIATLTHIGSNVWTFASTTGRGNEARCEVAGGQHTLSGTLDRIQLTATNGTDAFDLGNVNIFYE